MPEVGELVLDVLRRRIKTKTITTTVANTAIATAMPIVAPEPELVELDDCEGDGPAVVSRVINVIIVIIK